MSTLQEYMSNQTNCVDLWKLGKCAWDQELGKMESVFCIMRWCLSTLGSLKYILHVAYSISVCIFLKLVRYYLLYYVVLNLITVIKMNMIDEVPCSSGTPKTNTVKIWHQISCRECGEVSASVKFIPDDLYRGLNCFQSFLQTCTEVSAAPKINYPNSEII